MWRRLVTSDVVGLVQILVIASKRRASVPGHSPLPLDQQPLPTPASDLDGDAARHINQRAEAAVIGANPLRGSGSGARQESNLSAVGPSPPPRSSASSAKVRIFDKFGMKADPAKVDISSSVEDLIQLLPDNLHSPARSHFRKFGITKLLETQRVTIPLVLEGRDVLCIAPPASGKTLTYLIPSLMQILSINHTRGDNVDDTLHRETSDRIARGELCKYCEMDVFQNPVCSFTGHPHRIPLDKDTLLDRKVSHFRELTSVSEPQLVIVVPTAQLAVQIRDTAVSLAFGLRIAALYRTNSPEEAHQMLKWFSGCQVLISTPEPLIAALLKGKLSFRKTQVVVMDEVDVLLSTNFFEQIKIFLGALPKHAARPQRLLFGATLPRPMHEMIRSTMLLPSHRFVRSTHIPGENPHLRAASAGGGNATPSSSPSPHITHAVLMLSRVEKVDRLVRMFADGDLSGSQRTLIFCASRTNVQYVSEQLTTRLRSTPAASTARVGAISSAMTQTARDAVIRMFQSGVISVLVSTDLLSRGIDFHKVVSVVHYDMPLDMNTWLHRNGRCGRHGDPGWVWSLFQPENVKLAKPLVAYLRQHGQLVPPKLREYAKQNFLDIFKSSTFHHPTKGYNQGRNPERHTPVLGRGLPLIPDFKQRSHNRNFRSK